MRAPFVPKTLFSRLSGLATISRFGAIGLFDLGHDFVKPLLAKLKDYPFGNMDMTLRALQNRMSLLLSPEVSIDSIGNGKTLDAIFKADILILTKASCSIYTLRSLSMQTKAGCISAAGGFSNMGILRCDGEPLSLISVDCLKHCQSLSNHLIACPEVVCQKLLTPSWLQETNVSTFKFLSLDLSQSNASQKEQSL